MIRFQSSNGLSALLVLHRKRANDKSLQFAVKRTIDFTAAIALLLMLAPLMLIIAVLIRSCDGGPALFRQWRIGKSGKTFRCWKFRTMACNADEALQGLLSSDPVAAKEWAEGHKLARDPRITPVGAFLRRSSLDELPQLFNIIVGEMTFVGPRPIVPAERERYGEAFAHCFSVPPGLTGLWQVSGRSDCSYATRVSLDSQYASEWHLLLDAKILARTVPAVLMQRGSR